MPNIQKEKYYSHFFIKEKINEVLDYLYQDEGIYIEKLKYFSPVFIREKINEIIPVINTLKGTNIQLEKYYTPLFFQDKLNEIVVAANVETNTEPQPEISYNLLTSPQLILDAKNLAIGANNDYGTVDGSGNITSWKSVTPAPVGRNFSVVGSGLTLSEGSILFNGSGRLVNTTKANWSFLHYNATLANLTYTVYMVCKIGNVASPDADYGLFGNNGGVSTGVGRSLIFLDTSTNDRGTNTFITRGVNNAFILNYTQQLVLPTNAYFVYCQEIIMSQTGNNRMNEYINGTIVTKTQSVTSNSTAPVATSTYDFEIGGVGNSALPLVGGVKELIISGGLDSSEVRNTIINELKTKHGIA